MPLNKRFSWIRLILEIFRVSVSVICCICYYTRMVVKMDALQQDQWPTLPAEGIQIIVLSQLVEYVSTVIHILFYHEINYSSYIRSRLLFPFILFLQNPGNVWCKSSRHLLYTCLDSGWAVESAEFTQSYPIVKYHVIFPSKHVILIYLILYAYFQVFPSIILQIVTKIVIG